MAWIYLAASEDSPLPWRLGSDRSPTVRATDTLNLCCFLAWHGATCFQLPYGEMCEHFAEAISIHPESTSSTAASHARTSVLRELVAAWKESARDYFLRSRDSLAKYSLLSSSWKTCLPFGGAGPTLLPDDWPDSGMTLAGECFPLLMWERRTCGSAGGFWPTATATDSKSSRNATVKKRKVQGHSGVTLTDFVTLFPTPTAATYGSRNNGKRGDGTTFKTAGAPSLETMARKNLWPTPVADDAVNRTKGKWNSRGEPKLSAAVMLWPTPRAQDGPKGGPSQGDTLPAAVGGQLNPTWVEWLMGYPLGWTALEGWATQWFLRKRAKRSSASRASKKKKTMGDYGESAQMKRSV